MSDNITKLLDRYHIWIQDRTVVQQFDEWNEITTPYLDRHNDYLRIYVKINGDNITLTDDGYTLNDLELSGFEFSSNKRKRILESIANGFDVVIEDNRLTTITNTEGFARKLQDLIQAMLSIGDLSFASHTSERGAFQENAGLWLSTRNISFDSNIKIKGSSGNERVIHYLIFPINEQPLKFLQTIKHPDSRSVNSFTYIWLDIRASQPENARMYVLLNDLERKPTRESYRTLETNKITPLLWSNRDAAISELAA